jgi:hypothetical protein
LLGGINANLSGEKYKSAAEYDHDETHSINYFEAGFSAGGGRHRWGDVVGGRCRF